LLAFCGEMHGRSREENALAAFNAMKLPRCIGKCSKA